MLLRMRPAVARPCGGPSAARGGARPATILRVRSAPIRVTSLRRYSDSTAPPSSDSKPPASASVSSPQLKDLPPRSSFAPAGRNDPRFSANANTQNRDTALTSKEYNALINKHVRAEKYNTVFKLHKEMQDKKLTPTLETLNNVIRAYLASGLTHKAWKTFEEIEYNRLTPNIFTLNCLVEASLFKDDLEEAYAAIEMFKTRYDISANAYTYIQFINAYARRGDLAKCFEQLDAMKANNVPYLTPTYEAILSACIKLKDISRVAEVLQAMLDSKLLPPNSAILLQLLKIATTEDNMQVASIIMAHLQRSETAVLTQGQILELLDSAARKERPDFAEVVWQWMKRQKHTPDLLCYNSLLYAYVNSKDMKKALSVLNAMHEAGIEPHGPALAYFQQHLLTTVESMDAAYYALEDLANEGEKVSPAGLCMIITACSNAGDLERAYLTYNAYEKFGLKPDINAVNALLEGCAKTRTASPAFKLMETLPQIGLQPTVVTFENLISACLAANDVDVAIDVLNNLPPQIPPSYKMFSSIVRRCALNGEVAKASIIVESMRACGMEPQEALVAFIESDGKIPLQPKLRYHRSTGWMHRGKVASFATPQKGGDGGQAPPASPSAKGTF